MTPSGGPARVLPKSGKTVKIFARAIPNARDALKPSRRALAGDSRRHPIARVKSLRPLGRAEEKRPFGKAFRKCLATYSVKIFAS
jgi:hypothetical protein